MSARACHCEGLFVINSALLLSVLPSFILCESTESIRRESCWALLNITAGPEKQVFAHLVCVRGLWVCACLCHCEGVPASSVLRSVLECLVFCEGTENIHRVSCWALSNITAGPEKQVIMCVISPVLGPVSVRACCEGFIYTVRCFCPCSSSSCV